MIKTMPFLLNPSSIHYQMAQNVIQMGGLTLHSNEFSFEIIKDWFWQHFLVGMHGYPAKYLFSGQIVEFFTICICVWPETFLLSVSVSSQLNANRYRYKKKLLMYNSAQWIWCTIWMPLNANVQSDLDLRISGIKTV